MIDTAMRGRLDIIPLLELLSSLARSRKSGTLGLHSSSQSVVIKIEDGSVRSVTPADPSLRIGQMLIRLGISTEEQIEQALALQLIARDPERIGKVLVDVGHISETDISRAVTAQIQHALNAMLDDDDRHFVFTETDEVSGEPPLCGIALDPMVLVVANYAEFWLQRFGVTTLQAQVPNSLDQEALDSLTAHQRELIIRLITLYHRMNGPVAERNPHAYRVQRSIERVLKHVLIQIANRHRKNRESEQPTQYTVRFVDQRIDLWALSDLTRNARLIVQELLNGRNDLAELIGELQQETSNPIRAIQELESVGLITVVPASPDEQETGDPEADRENDEDRRMLFRLLPREA